MDKCKHSVYELKSCNRLQDDCTYWKCCLKLVLVFVTNVYCDSDCDNDNMTDKHTIYMHKNMCYTSDFCKSFS